MLKVGLYHGSRLLCLAKPIPCSHSHGFHSSAPHCRGPAPRRPKSVAYRKPTYRITTADSQPPLSTDTARLRLDRELNQWISSPLTTGRFTALGVVENLETKLVEFAFVARDELTSSEPLDEELWDTELLSKNMDRGFAFAADAALSYRFVAWAAKNIEGHVGEMLKQFRKVTDFRHITLKYTEARSMSRKVIMHVGPTNSGKTYNALRALVGARTGFYAGPLRLLAHEVYERINKGTIEPLTPLEPGQLSAARPCNLVTGEDTRIVDRDAGITSCTVEMLQTVRIYDVGVVDEIQMISDIERGAAWTNAVLGAKCEELHLCGEESAVPLIREMLADTSDEIIVQRYDRLSPLQVAKESLHGNWKNIRKGDCVVTFSRTGIFKLKQRIERETGLRCAVAYGKLPPEIRVEQAALFNQPDSGYDVMVASDAIGLGLNLKIKRIVFEAVTKFDGRKDVQLSMSQIKQIGGRAGRFDHTTVDQAPGLVTSLYSADLPVIIRAMSKSHAPPLDRAVIGWTNELALQAYQYIPRHVTLYALQDILSRCGRFGKTFVMQDCRHLITETAEDAVQELSMYERFLISSAPHSLADPLGVKIFQSYISSHVGGQEVDVVESLKQSGLWDTLETARRHYNQLVEDPNLPFDMELQTTRLLQKIEMVHSSLSLYVWLAYRLPASFTMAVKALELKREVENILQTCLTSLDARRLRQSRIIKPANVTQGLGTENDLIPFNRNMDPREEAAHVIFSLTDLHAPAQSRNVEAVA